MSVDTGGPKKDIIRDAFQSVDQRGIEWFFLNRNTILVLAPATIFGTDVLLKLIRGCIRLQKAKKARPIYCFDSRVGHDWILRRELSNNEWLVIDARTKNGEELCNILSEMKVLR
jgi:hypothetical protein